MAREHAELQQLRPSISALRNRAATGARCATRTAPGSRSRSLSIDKSALASDVLAQLPAGRRPAQQVLGRDAARARRRCGACDVRRQHRRVRRQQRAASLASGDVPAVGAGRRRSGAARRESLSGVLREPWNLEYFVDVALGKRPKRTASRPSTSRRRTRRRSAPRNVILWGSAPTPLATRCSFRHVSARSTRRRGAQDRRPSLRHALRPWTERRRQRHELHRRRPHAVQARRPPRRLRGRRRGLEQRADRRCCGGPRAHAARASRARGADRRAALGPRAHAVGGRHRADQTRIERRAADGQRRVQWGSVREGRAVRVLRRCIPTSARAAVSCRPQHSKRPTTICATSSAGRPAGATSGESRKRGGASARDAL